jgi:hypothetical protein
MEAELVAADLISAQLKSKYNIRFDEIGNEIEFVADNLLGDKILRLLFSFWTIGSIVLCFVDEARRGAYVAAAFLAGMISILMFIKPRMDDIIITNGKITIRFFRNKPNEEEVMKFAKLLVSISNKSKRDRYINFELDEELFMANFSYLLNQKVINKDEFHSLKEDYKIKRLF